MKHETSGYCDCACGTCFEVAIASAGDEVGTVLCYECKKAGCEPGKECQYVSEMEEVDHDGE